jgi:hypothetical protein
LMFLGSLRQYNICSYHEVRSVGKIRKYTSLEMESFRQKCGKNTDTHNGTDSRNQDNLVFWAALISGYNNHCLGQYHLPFLKLTTS